MEQTPQTAVTTGPRAGEALRVRRLFTQAQRITRFLGQGGLQAFSKVAYLLLAAIAVQLIRRGIMEVLQQL